MERFFSRYQIDLLEKGLSLEGKKKQKIVFYNLNRFNSKHYPRIFFDQRLSSTFLYNGAK